MNELFSRNKKAVTGKLLLFCCTMQIRFLEIFIILLKEVINSRWETFIAKKVFTFVNSYLGGFIALV